MRIVEKGECKYIGGENTKAVRERINKRRKRYCIEEERERELTTRRKNTIEWTEKRN